MAARRLVLIVEDEPVIAEFLSMKLGASGCETVMVENGAEALDWLEDHRPDLVITDFHMPFVNGLDLCRRLETVAGLESVPVILLSARGPIDTTPTPANLAAVIAKPFCATRVVTRSIQLLNEPLQRSVPGLHINCG
jgi:CheY-like chemotaxis protein